MNATIVKQPNQSEVCTCPHCKAQQIPEKKMLWGQQVTVCRLHGCRKIIKIGT